MLCTKECKGKEFCKRWIPMNATVRSPAHVGYTSMQERGLLHMLGTHHWKGKESCTCWVPIDARVRILAHVEYPAIHG